MSVLKKKILGGVFWTTTESVVNRGFDLFIQFLLARLLFPEDFGLVGMALVFVSFLQVLNDLGLGNAIVQKNRNLLQRLHYSTAFWTGIFWSVFLFLIICLAAPYISGFYDEPLVAVIVPALSITLVSGSVSVVHRALLLKNMQFRKLALVNTVSNTGAGIVALLMARAGFEFWALVSYSVAKSVFVIPLSFFVTRWTPSLEWSKAHFAELFGFGKYTTGTAMANVVAQRSDFLLVGKFLGATTLGFYAFAFLLTHTLRSQITGVINKVMYPVYVTLQHEPERLLKLYLKVLSLNILLIYPLIVTIFLFSEYILTVFFASKWDDAVTLIKILSISVLIQMWVNSNQALFRAYGKVHLEFNLQLVKSFIFFVPCVWLGIYYDGARGAAVGFTLATFLSAVLTLFYLNKIFQLKLIQLLEVLKIPLLIVVVCGGSSLYLLHFLDWKIVVLVYGGFVGSLLMFFAKNELRFLRQLIKHRNLTFMDQDGP
jgi:teichuronic acid exporter